MYLFSLEEINIKDLKLILSKVGGQIRKDDFVEFIIQFYSIKLTKNEMIELLRDEDQYVSRYALYRCGYDRYPELIPVIEKRLNNFSYYNRLVAINSLSLLLGKKLGMDEWINFKNGKSFQKDGTFFKPDCEKIKNNNFDTFKNLDFPYLAVCLRAMVNREDLNLLQSIESNTWDNFPLNSREENVVRKVLKR
jgi:hypothetical protein